MRYRARCLLLAVSLWASLSALLPVMAAGTVSVAAWLCPPATNPAADTAALPTTCTQPADGVTFALTAGGLTRRRVASSGQAASWPAVAGPFTLAIATPAGEPAIVVCDQNGTTTRYDAPAGVVKGELAANGSLTCRWYRLGSASPTPTVAPTAAPTTAPTAAPTQTPAAAAAIPAHFQGRVDIGGRSLYLACTGTGTPTVLLEAGGPGGFSNRWGKVAPQLATTVRVCGYDRAGLGQSDPAPAGVRTIQDSVSDLRALLNRVPLGCPCVFVGESWGGSIVRVFAGQFPGDVAGLVFLDPVPPGFVDKFVGLVSSNEPGFAALMGTDNPERMDQLASFRQADAAALPPSVPIVVVTHGLFLGFPLTFPVEKLEAAWRSEQEAYARATHAQLVVAQRSGNSVLRDQPDVVVTTVQTVVGVVRNPASLQTSLAVHRLDATGRPLPGGCFQVYLDAGGGKRGDFRGGACDADDGAADGVIHFLPLPPGNYVLQEARPPGGVPASPDMPVTLAGLATDVDVKSAAPATPTAPAAAKVTPTP